MASWLENGFITRPSPYSVDETVERLKRTLDAKGITLFALVDHSGEAAKAVLRMRPTKLLLFGNPKAGTPVMLAAPSSAIDLPLKVLIAENGEGQGLVSYNDPGYLQHRHAIPPELLTKISVVEQLVAQALSYSG